MKSYMQFVQRFKASLFCGGNHQIEGIDYQATYALTACLGRLRQEITIGAKYDLEIHHMDVCTAFLGVHLEEEIYMHPPQEYFSLLQTGKLTKMSLKMVLRLRQSHYGLKQSSHIGYGAFIDFVISMGFVASHVDRALLVLHNHDQDLVVAKVVLYVDDLLIIANEGLIWQIKDQMKKRFRMHDLGSVSFNLSMNIECNWELHTIHIHQDCYIRTILAKFKMDKSRPVAMPMAKKLHKRKPDEEACDPTLRQSIIASLIYAMTDIPPDIANAITVPSLYNHDPSDVDMVAFKDEFRYLHGTKDWRLRFAGEAECAVRCEVESDYVGSPDVYKSSSGLVATFGEAVDWRSSKQKSTAQSTADANTMPVRPSLCRVCHHAAVG